MRTKIIKRLVTISAAALIFAWQLAVPLRAAAATDPVTDGGPQTGSVEVNKRIDPEGDGSFKAYSSTTDELGLRWGLDGATPANPMNHSVDGVNVGAHTISENTVNGYQFVGWYTTGSGHSCSEPEGTTLPVPVTVTKNEITKITLCNQLKKGSITIVKDADPASDQTFGFSSEALGNFTLDGSTENSKTFSKLTPDQTYIISEDQTEGWQFDSIVCSEGADVTISTAGRMVTINLHPGDDVTCTFSNHKQGSITVHKHTVPTGDTTPFTIAASGSGTIYGDSERTIKDGESQTFSVSPGTYAVTEENMPEGWVQLSNTCKDMTISSENPTHECDITNVQAATLTIVKDAVPDSDQTFNFASDKLGDFSLSGTGSDSKTFNNLVPGQYTISEEQTAGWMLAGISCTGNDSERTASDTSDQHLLTLALQPGSNITCTFINAQQGSISGTKFNDLNNNGQWDEGEPGLAGWTIKLTKVCDASDGVDALGPLCEDVTQTAVTDNEGAYSFGALDPGRYLVCEEQQSGWAQTYPTDNNGCLIRSVEEPGERLTANFGNFQYGAISGTKFNDVNGNGQRDTNEPALSGWTISLFRQAGATAWEATPLQTAQTDANGAYRFDSLASGAYKVCETQKANWQRTLPAGSDCYELTVATSGQTLTADFGNKPVPQVLGAATTAVQPTQLVSTGASAGTQVVFGLALLGSLGALHVASRRRKDFIR